LRGTASQIASETYVPLGTTDFGDVLAALPTGRVDGVIMLLMGQDAVHFNRQFARQGLADKVVRLSPAIEENTLLAGGADAHQNLYAAAAYFEGLNTVEGSDLERAYYRRFGPLAPALNAVGESCYEAIHFLGRMGTIAGSVDVAALGAISSTTSYDSPRGLVRFDGNLLDQDVYLAAANGLEFEIQDQIATAS